MSAEAQAVQVESQAVQVEEEYHHEDKREHKAMDAKLLAPKFNANLLVMVFGDNLSTGSVKSGGGDRPLPAALFFHQAQARVATLIGEPRIVCFNSFLSVSVALMNPIIRQPEITARR